MVRVLRYKPEGRWFDSRWCVIGTFHARHAATIPKWYGEINVTFYSVTLARTIRLPDDGPRTETRWSVFDVLMCKFYKFYICAVVGIIIE